MGSPQLASRLLALADCVGCLPCSYANRFRHPSSCVQAFYFYNFLSHPPATGCADGVLRPTLWERSRLTHHCSRTVRSRRAWSPWNIIMWLRPAAEFNRSAAETSSPMQHPSQQHSTDQAVLREMASAEALASTDWPSACLQMFAIYQAANVRHMHAVC